MWKRIVRAGVLGGIAMFLWTSLAHMVLPLGQAGIREIPNEQLVLAVMQASLGGTSGLYLFPGTGAGENASRQERNAAMQQYGRKLAGNPSGLLIYHPPGAKALTPGQLITEVLTEIAEVLLAAFLLSLARLESFGGRIGFIGVVGVVAAIATNISYWNWYGFPPSYTAAYMTTQLVGFAVAGAVAALLMKNPASQLAAAAA